LRARIAPFDIQAIDRNPDGLKIRSETIFRIEVAEGYRYPAKTPSDLQQAAFSTSDAKTID
jgi:hypothetical protein